MRCGQHRDVTAAILTAGEVRPGLVWEVPTKRARCGPCGRDFLGDSRKSRHNALDVARVVGTYHDTTPDPSPALGTLGFQSQQPCQRINRTRRPIITPIADQAKHTTTPAILFTGRRGAVSVAASPLRAFRARVVGCAR